MRTELNKARKVRQMINKNYSKTLLALDNDYVIKLIEYNNKIRIELGVKKGQKFYPLRCLKKLLNHNSGCYEYGKAESNLCIGIGSLEKDGFDNLQQLIIELSKALSELKNKYER